MVTIKWKENIIIECIDEEGNDWCESMEEGDEFDVDNVEVNVEDAENGDMVSIYHEGIVMTANSQWFNII